MKKFQKTAYVATGLLMGLSIAFTPTALASSGTKALQATFRDIKIVVDGKTITPKDGNGNVIEPFVVDGTTYLPVRAVGEAFGKEVNWDGNTNTVYIGVRQATENQTNGNIKLSTLKHVSSSGKGFRHEEEIKDNKDVFRKDCFIVSCDWIGEYRDYTINGQYSKIDGVFFMPAGGGHPSAGYLFKIWGDGELLYKTPRLTNNIQPINFSADIKGVEQLKIGFEHGGNSASAELGISNVILHK